MVKMSTKSDDSDAVSAPGRTPPPVESRFKKGQSGNARGRPKGAVSVHARTKKFAHKSLTARVSGKQQRLSRLQLVILKLQALAAEGKPAAAALMSKVRDRAAPAPIPGSGILLVPPAVSLDEFIARELERTKDAVQPDTAKNLEAEEFIRAARGEPTALGEALLQFHRKYVG